MRHGGTLLYSDMNAPADDIIARVVERGVVEPIWVEQSNTSVCLDRKLIFKLFRKLENSELEIGRFLTSQTTVRAMPALRESSTADRHGALSADTADPALHPNQQLRRYTDLASVIPGSHFANLRSACAAHWRVD
jgi:predicted trehalose synthase